MANKPGITVSIIRQQTSGQTGSPLNISGRVSILGIPVPSFVRVSLVGPSYNPETTNFDTIADPFTGNYAANVVAPTDGEYTVQAQAYPLPLVPSTPLTQTPILLPSIGSSDSPPLVFGKPTAGGVSAEVPGGTTSLPAPSASPIEVNVGAPNISVSIPAAIKEGISAIALPTLPSVPTPTPSVPVATPSAPTETPTLPTPSVPSTPVVTPVSPVTPTPTTTGVQMPNLPTTAMLGVPTSSLPNTANVGDVWSGQVNLPTQMPYSLLGATSTPSYQFATQVYLKDSSGNTYPIVSQNFNAQPGQGLTIPVKHNTSDLKAGSYTVYLKVAASNGNVLMNQLIGYLTLASLVKPPVLATGAMFGTPTVSVPSSLTQGQTLSGTIGVPSLWPSTLPQPTSLPSYSVTATPFLLGPDGAYRQMGSARSLNFTPGGNLSVPFSYNTQQVPVGINRVVLMINDTQGNTIFNQAIAAVNIIAAPSTTTTTVHVTAPSLPTANMLGSPSASLPSSITQGQVLSGTISLPTVWPSSLPRPSSLPSYPVTVSTFLVGSDGFYHQQAAARTLSLVPGQTLSIPVSFNTSSLSTGANKLVLQLNDAQGNTIFNQAVGSTNITAAAPATLTTAGAKFQVGQRVQATFVNPNDGNGGPGTVTSIEPFAAGQTPNYYVLWDSTGTTNIIGQQYLKAYTAPTTTTTSTPTAGPRFTVGDVIQFNGILYTVHAVTEVAPYQYILWKGIYPNDTPSYTWVDASNVDGNAALIKHVTISEV